MFFSGRVIRGFVDLTDLNEERKVSCYPRNPEETGRSRHGSCVRPPPTVRQNKKSFVTVMNLVSLLKTTTSTPSRRFEARTFLSRVLKV